MEKQLSIIGKQVAIVAADGVDEGSLYKMKNALEEKGLQTCIVSLHADSICSSKGKAIKVDQRFVNVFPQEFDAVYIPGGEDSIFTLQGENEVIRFINEAYRSSKPIAADGEGEELLYVTAAGKELNTCSGSSSVLVNRTSREFIKTIGQYQLWPAERISA